VTSEGRDSQITRSSARTPPHISVFRWIYWWVTLFIALILFYGLFSIFWFGLRAAAWVAEFRSRRRRSR
jgi:hypothetical protein